ncbi:MAG: accessory Sec system glycosylation chaperone GtfB [Lachnospiraceae bacterium]|nr:accessory Sec system glycosylation chaperone GtfB [Lachnospiraceae bacterium]
MGALRENSYKRAAAYLEDKVAEKWALLLGNSDDETCGNEPRRNIQNGAFGNEIRINGSAENTDPGDLADTPDFVLLLDNTGRDSMDLYASFKSTGKSFFAAVLSDDGFIPGEMESVYGFFLGYRAGTSYEGKPRYFNGIRVPKYWEISGTGRGGKITDMSHERGRIFYAEPSHKRYVKTVDYYDEKGIVRFSDHYNRYGALYSRTAFSAGGERINRSFFSADGKEIIVENFVTRDIILNYKGKILIFKNKTEFAIFYLKERGLSGRRLFYNSLSYPFFVSEDLPKETGGDILFWQEDIKDDIPGNMKIILNGRSSRTGRIVVQNRSSYEKLRASGANMDMITLLGFVYPFERENRYGRDILIGTNSDNIACLDEITAAVKDCRFHIAALTEMSAKLMAFGDRENVILYPGVSMAKLDELFAGCDIYLDINHENEIVSAVRRAFLNNMLILAFRETLHDGIYTEKGHIFGKDEPDRLTALLTSALNDRAVMEQSIRSQREHALLADEAAYKTLIKDADSYKDQIL